MTNLSSSSRQLAAIASFALLAACGSHHMQQPRVSADRGLGSTN
jgi:hypothetical protein